MIPVFHQMLLSIPGMNRFWKEAIRGGCVRKHPCVPKIAHGRQCMAFINSIYNWLWTNLAEVEGHMVQGQIRVPNRGRWAQSRHEIAPYKPGAVIWTCPEPREPCLCLFFWVGNAALTFSELQLHSLLLKLHSPRLWEFPPSSDWGSPYSASSGENLQL